MFWAYHPNTNQKVVVGYYNHVRQAEPADWGLLDDYFSYYGIYKRRAEELHKAVPKIGVKRALEEINNSVKNRYLRLKCPVAEVNALPFSGYYPLPKEVDGKKINHRFGGYTYLNKIPSPTPHESPPPPPDVQIQPLATDGYYREHSERQDLILRQHNELSNQFARWLRKKKEYANVRQEESGVDVEFTFNNDLCRAELKICHGVGSTKAIREALGQLFEYNYYGNRIPAKHWYIILDQEPSISDKHYLRTLSKTFDLPLALGWKTRRSLQFFK